MTPKIINNKNSIDISDADQMETSAWIDVRCQREFEKGHFTNSINIPLFSDSEYQKIGEIYKKDVLLDFANEMRMMLSEKNLKKFPDMPIKGNLDLDLVKKSVFFCI